MEPAKQSPKGWVAQLWSARERFAAQTLRPAGPSEGPRPRSPLSTHPPCNRAHSPAGGLKVPGLVVPVAAPAITLVLGSTVTTFTTTGPISVTATVTNTGARAARAPRSNALNGLGGGRAHECVCGFFLRARAPRLISQARTAAGL